MRSVRSWSGTAEPSSAADGRGRPGAVGDDERDRRRERRGRRRRTLDPGSRRSRSRARPRRGGTPAARARRASALAVVRDDQHEPGVGRPSRRGGRGAASPGRASPPAGACPPRPSARARAPRRRSAPEPTTMIRSTSPELRGESLDCGDCGSRLQAGGEEPRGPRRIDRARPTRWPADRGGGEDRREVADGVAPALVLLARSRRRCPPAPRRAIDR